MNPDTKKELENRARGVAFWLAEAVLNHLSENYRVSRECVDNAIRVAVFGETKIVSEWRKTEEIPTIKVASDVKK